MSDLHHRAGGINIVEKTTIDDIIKKFDPQLTAYNECFDCGKVEYVLRQRISDAKLTFKVVPISIHIPNRLDSLTGWNIALCPQCFEMMSDEDFWG